MKTARENIERIRQIMLVNMDTIITCDIGDENIIESWLMCGLPDGWTNDDLVDIAEEYLTTLTHNTAEAIKQLWQALNLK